MPSTRGSVQTQDKPALPQQRGIEREHFVARMARRSPSHASRSTVVGKVPDRIRAYRHPASPRRDEALAVDVNVSYCAVLSSHTELSGGSSDPGVAVIVRDHGSKDHGLV